MAASWLLVLVGLGALVCASAAPLEGSAVSFLEASSLLSGVCSPPDTCCGALKCPHANGVCCPDARSCCPARASCLPSVAGQPQQCGLGVIPGPTVRVPCPTGTCNNQDVMSYVRSLNAAQDPQPPTPPPTTDEDLIAKENQLRAERKEKRETVNERFEKQLQSQTNEALMKVAVIKALQAGQNAAASTTIGPDVGNNKAVQQQNELLTKMLVDVQTKRVSESKQQAQKVEQQASQKVEEAQAAAAAAAAAAKAAAEQQTAKKPQDDEDDKFLKALHEEVVGVRNDVNALSNAQTSQASANQLHAIIAVRRDVDGMRAELETLKAKKETSDESIQQQANQMLDAITASQKVVKAQEASDRAKAKEFKMKLSKKKPKTRKHDKKGKSKKSAKKF